MKKVSCVILAIFVVVLAGCGAPDISAYRDEQIKVTGLLEEDFLRATEKQWTILNRLNSMPATTTA